MTEKEILDSLSRKANAQDNEKKAVKKTTKPRVAKSKDTSTEEASTVKKTAAKSTAKTAKSSATTKKTSTIKKSAKTNEEIIQQKENLENQENQKLQLNESGELKSTQSADNNEPPLYTSSDEAIGSSASDNVPDKSVGAQAASNDTSHEEISKEPEPDAEEIEPMTLLDHLKELRIRLTRIVVVVLIGFFACYSFAELAYNFLTEPLIANMPENASLIYTSPPGLFFVYLKVAFVMSFFVSSPYTFYQLWAFVAPGLYTEEKKILIPLATISALFFFAGAAFCYFMVLPIAFKFFMGFATATITPMISVEEYLTFVLKLLIAFGVVFEMPLFSFFLARMGLVTANKMRKWRKYSILMMFITAALLTPPDVFSQTLMAMPMILLYEISILIAAMVEKEKRGEKDRSETKIETK